MTAPSRREHAGRTGIRWAVTLGVQVAWRTVRHRWGEGRKGVLARATKLPLDSCGRDGGLVSQRERALERGDVEAMWAAARERVRVRVGDRNFAAWIAPLSCTRTSGTVTLLAPDRTTRDWVARHFLTAIEEALAAAAGRSCHVQLGVAAPPPILPIPTRAPNAEQTFDTFVVGESNARAYEAATALGSASLGSSLFLHGPTGVGKTHLLHAVFHALHGNGTIVACLPAAQLVSALVAAYGRHGHEAFWRDLAPLGALLLDDVHSLAGQEELQERLMEGLVEWVEGGRTLVLTSDRAPRDMPELAARVRERFEGGEVACIDLPEPALRLAILQRKARGQGIEFPPRLVARLAARIAGDVRRLEGALTRLAAHARLSGRPLDETLAEEVIPELRVAPTLDVDRIVEATAAAFGCPARLLRGRSRRAQLVLPRQVAMYLARKLMARPFAELAAQFTRDHTTVLHAWRIIGARLETDRTLATTVAQIEERLLSAG